MLMTTMMRVNIHSSFNYHLHSADVVDHHDMSDHAWDHFVGVAPDDHVRKPWGGITT